MRLHGFCEHCGEDVTDWFSCLGDAISCPHCGEWTYVQKYDLEEKEEDDQE